MTVADRVGFSDSAGLVERVRHNPRPALVWTGVAAVLVGLQAGALLKFLASTSVDVVQAFNGVRAVPFAVDPAGLTRFERAAAEVPRLLSRETVPNHGYYDTTAGRWAVGPVYQDPETGRWVGTFMGWEPKHAWLARVVLVYAYTAVSLAWLWTGYRWWRRHYRVADWTPRDDVVDRFRNHGWGKFGLVVVLVFLTTVLFGPALAPTTNQVNNVDPYSYEMQYAADGAVETISVGVANTNTFSDSTQTVGPWEYDRYDRFHPFGTMPAGQDLFTFIMYGARLSLIVGLVTVGLSTALATTAAMVSAYYKGYVDLGMVLVSDVIFALPGLLLLIMLSVLLGGTWIAEVYSGGILLALIFAATGWPGLWRSIRGPALQTAEQEWVDAARSFGQRPSTVMRKHILPYLTGYLLVYGSMSLGGVIIGIAGLSFLGLGINPPTPEWGRAVNVGQAYIDGPSWHISIIPGLLVTVVVIGFNALGDGIRDAIDPESDAETADTGGAERGGGA